ncbi:GAF domain-containing protein [Streptomyces sp. NPDC006265]|uniref:GAF domain-containing protein n=1 Tax=Streptomyces sp. NPDC006265 TaxID=3156740 RepID=UPI0033BAC38A
MAAALKPWTWPRKVKLAIPSGAGAVAFALQSIAGFDVIDLSTWEFSLITAGGVTGAFFAVWLPLAWQRKEAQQVQTLEQQVEDLNKESEVNARNLMYDYLNQFFQLNEFSQKLAGAPEDRRRGYEHSVKERAVKAAATCANDVRDLRVSFFHVDGPSKLAVSCHSDSPRGALKDLIKGTKHADYIFDAIRNNKGAFEENLRSPKSAVRWPAKQRDFQTLAFCPVRTEQATYGVLMIDAPNAGDLKREHYAMLSVVAQHAAAGLALCDGNLGGAQATI